MHNLMPVLSVDLIFGLADHQGQQLAIKERALTQACQALLAGKIVAVKALVASFSL